MPVTKRADVVPVQVADGGWGWVCVAACAFNLALYRGVAMSFSILYEAMRVKYGTTATATAWVYSICGVVMYCTSILVSPLCKKVGCRAIGMVGGVLYGLGMILTAFSTNINQIYFTYGVLVGLADCSIVVTTSLVVNQYFNKHRAKAMSLNTMGVSAGTVIFTNLMSEMTERFSLTFCLIILGCISLHQVLASAMFRPPEVQRNTKSNEQPSHDVEGDAEINLENESFTNEDKESTDAQNVKSKEDQCDNEIDITVELQPMCSTESIADQETRAEQLKECCLYYCDVDLMKNPRFLGLFFMTMCFSTSVFMVDTSLAGWSAERGVSIRQVSWVISVGTVMEVIARVSTGLIFDLKMVRPIRTYIYGGVTICAAATLTLFPSAYNFPTTMVAFITFRFWTCIYYTHSSVILADVATPAKMYGALGILQFARGISSIVGPVMAGFIKDELGSFNISFYIGGALAMCSIVLYFLTLEYTRRWQKKEKAVSR